MSDTPHLRLVVDNGERDDRVRDIFMQTTAVAADPDGDAIWLLLEPKPSTPSPA